MTLPAMLLMTTTMMMTSLQDVDGGVAHRCDEKMSGAKLPMDLLPPIIYRVSAIGTAALLF